MRKKKITEWRDGLVINLISNVIGFFVGVTVTYLKHDGSTWVSPLLCGGAAWFLTFGILAAIRLFRYIPYRPLRVNDANLQSVLRDWLDDLGLKVQSSKDDSCHFKFIVTTDSGRVITLRRDRANFPEHLTFMAFFKEDEQKAAFSNFTNEEKAEIRLTLQLELSRAVMGYLALDILDGFTLFKRIPISSSLTVEDVSRTLWEVEAALSSVFYAGTIFLARHRSLPLSTGSDR